MLTFAPIDGLTFCPFRREDVRGLFRWLWACLPAKLYNAQSEAKWFRVSILFQDLNRNITWFGSSESGTVATGHHTFWLRVYERYRDITIVTRSQVTSKASGGLEAAHKVEELQPGFIAGGLRLHPANPELGLRKPMQQ
jgi:hypothetical protein